MIICKRCALNRGFPPESLPPVRTSNRKCESCGSSDDPTQRGRNYDIANVNVPGHKDDPNRQAELEEASGE